VNRQPRKPVKRVSVVTVCLNAEATMDQTMRSVQDQTHSEIEHVVIDGKSTDGTVKIAMRYEPATLVSERDGGIYEAMEKGARLSTGDVLFFLNSGDTFFDENVIADIVSFFNREDADAVFGNLLPHYAKEDDNHDHPAFTPGRVMDFSYFANRRLFFTESVHHQATFYRKEIFDVCSFLARDAAANGEYHLNVQAFVQRGFMLKHIPRIVCKFALGGTSTTNFSIEWAKFAAARSIIREEYFPNGPGIERQSAFEYLVSFPGPVSFVKIVLREAGVLDFLRAMREKLPPYGTNR